MTSWAKQAEREIKLYRENCARVGSVNPTWRGISRVYAQGMRTEEAREDMYSVRLGYGVLIPVKFDVSAKILRTIEDNKYSFTTNQDSINGMGACAQSRNHGLGGEDKWIRDRSKKALKEGMRENAVHTVEVYGPEDKWPVAYVLGFQLGGEQGEKRNGGLFVSMSLVGDAQNRPGAGYAAFVTLQAILCRQGFGAHDPIMPSTVSSMLGGIMMPFKEYQAQRTPALHMEVDFPTIPDRISVMQYCQPLLAAKTR